MNVLLILGIDTSGKTAAAALFEDETMLGQVSIYTMKTQSQVILPEVKRLMTQCGREFSQLELLAVSKGPGSYTGIRIGLSAVKAMAFALGIPVCGVSSLEALAFGCGRTGAVCAVIKARQGIVYSGVYKIFPKKAPEVLLRDGVMTVDELCDRLKSIEGNISFTGDGAEEFLLEHCDDRFELVPPHLRLQSGSGVVMGAKYGEKMKPEEVQASYLQLVKAEKELLERTAAQPHGAS